MSLRREDFAAFFAALHDGYGPFGWQERLLDAVLDAGRWPDRVVAPTGSGKTAVIDVHVFAQALTGPRPTGQPPRRLAMVVDRRVLVDDQYEYARTLAARLATPDKPVLHRVAQALWVLRRPGETDRPQETDNGRDGARDGVSPLVVGRLRGGAPPSRAWRDHPTAVAVICATPDMWGSRLLLRGYGSAPRAWPREAGLLAVDAVVVVDEAHLARQLLCTARRVSDLVAVADTPLAGPVLQVVETTATPDPSATAAGASIGVRDGDLDDPTLAARLTRPKPVTLLPVPDWAKPRSAAGARRLADAVTELVTAGTDRRPEPAAGQGQSGPDMAGTVGCFVNTVARAVDVAAELRHRKVGGRALRVVLVCGQVRPHDLDRLRQAHPGLLSPTGNADVDVLVATQSLEVGVDLDLAAAVTDLATGSALAQRAGRVNRRGLRPHAPIVVAVPADGVTDKTRSGPYASAELADALAWVQEYAQRAEGMSPWNLRQHPPPPARSRRLLLQRPELADAWQWARSSDDLAAEPELDLWLADDFDDDVSLGVVVRQVMPADDDDAIRLVRDLPPQRHEVFSVPYRTAVEALRRPKDETGPDRGGSQWRDRDGAQEPPAGVVLRAGEVTRLDWRPIDGDETQLEPRVRPGDVIVIDASLPVFTASSDATGNGFTPSVLIPSSDAAGERATAGDVLTAQASLPGQTWARRQVGGVVLRIEPKVAGLDEETFKPLAARLAVVDGVEPGEPEVRASVQTWLNQAAPNSTQPMAAAAALLLAEHSKRSDVIVHRDNDGEVLRVLVVDRRKATADEDARQTWTPSGEMVSLASHQKAVADRAGLLGSALGLPTAMVEALRLAGEHHDDGKQDLRFQVRLGGRGEDLLAKSPPATTPWQDRRNVQASGLPTGWRHEQRSVLDCWDTVHAQDRADPALVARLVGTSHGHGRTGFPHTASELLPAATANKTRLDRARDLFDDGGWDHLMEATQQRYGVWGCAYLEAVLRAADGQVSQEGQ